MIRHTTIILFTLLAATGLKAQPLASAGMPADARSAGFAGTSVATDAHSMSLFTNMAAAGFGGGYTTEASYGFASLGHDNFLHSFGGYYRLNEIHTIGVGVRYFSPDKIANTTDGINFDEVKPYDLMIDLAYSYKLNNTLSLSANARYVNSKLNEGPGFKTASCVAVDLGMYYRRDAWTVGAVVSNAGMIVDYGVAKYRMPASVKAGAAYRWEPAEGHRVTGLAEARYNFMPSQYRFPSGGVGAEYMFRGMVAVRGGYNVASETKSAGNYGSVGAGVYIGPVVVDAAYNLAEGGNPMNKIWRVSAGVRF